MMLKIHQIKPKYKYKYKIIAHKSCTTGYLSAINKTDAITLVKQTFGKVIYVRKCYFYWPTATDKLIEWFTTLSLLMKEGIKIENALQIMSDYKHHKFSIGLLEFIKSGKSFYEAISHYQFFFDQQSILMSKSLLKILSIENTCEFIANYKTKIHEKYGKIQKSLIQPLITFGIALIACAVITMLLKNPIEDIFNELNAPLPYILVFINNLTKLKLIIFISILLSTVCLVIKYFDKLPFIKDCFIERDIFIAFYFIGNSLKNGLSIIDAIELALPAVKSISNALNKMKIEIMRGSAVFKSIQNSSIDLMYINIIRVHEVSGNLSQGFISASESANRSFYGRLLIIEKATGPIVTIMTTILILALLNTLIFPMYSCILNTFI
jgi:type II secretory pathway component PulF